MSKNVMVRALSLQADEQRYYEVPQHFRCGSMLYKVLAPDEVMTCDIMGKAHFCVECGISDLEYQGIKTITPELFERTFTKHFQQLLPYATREN